MNSIIDSLRALVRVLDEHFHEDREGQWICRADSAVPVCKAIANARIALISPRMTTTPHAELLTDDAKHFATVAYAAWQGLTAEHARADLDMAGAKDQAAKKWLDVGRAIERALLARLAEQQPVALDHIACIDDGQLRYMSGRCAPGHDCELYAMPGGGRAPALYTHPAAQPAIDAEALHAAIRSLGTLTQRQVVDVVRVVMGMTGGAQ